jgi:hypothetical protein
MGYPNDQRIKKALEDQAAEVFPSDLWRGITDKLDNKAEAGVEPQGKRGRFVRAVAACLAAALVLLLGLHVYSPLMTNPGEKPKTAGRELKQRTASAWFRKENKADKVLYDFPYIGIEGRRETDLRTAGKWLGFEIKLPRSPLAIGAGPPKLYLEEEVFKYMETTATAPKPDVPHRSGAEVMIRYPNGFEITIGVRHPDDPTRDYRGHTEADNREKDELKTAGVARWELTTVNGMEGRQIDQGRNISVTERTDGPPEVELLGSHKAVIIWYDSQTWAEFSVWGPYGVGLKELRRVVDSIYE